MPSTVIRSGNTIAGSLINGLHPEGDATESYIMLNEDLKERRILSRLKKKYKEDLITV